LSMPELGFHHLMKYSQLARLKMLLWLNSGNT
jgi:hypothetical protein